MRNIRLLIAYDGTDFHGWQRQPDVPTIQAYIETALESILAERITLYGSGRTDAGVHALSQVANFKTTSRIPLANLVKALNSLLPATVRIKSAEKVAESFHARYDATFKTYRYRILTAPIASPFIGRFTYHYPFPINRKKMASAARLLNGQHDFTSFAGSVGPARAPSLAPLDDRRANVRTICSSRILWRPRTSVLVYEVRGSGFLHHMVRNIVGTLIEVGRGKIARQSIVAILEARDRTCAGPTAPASGLCLVGVEYTRGSPSEVEG